MLSLHSTKNFSTSWVAALLLTLGCASARTTATASPPNQRGAQSGASATIGSRLTQIATTRQAVLTAGLTVVQRTSKGRLTLSQSGTVDFGPTSLGATSTQELRLVNTGRQSLRVKVNKPAQPFAIVNVQDEFVLNPGEENAINAGLDFSPDQAGPASDILKFTTNGKVKTVKLKLKGTGVD